MTWAEFDNGINKLVDKINKSGIHFEFLIGIPRGGLIPAVALSHKLDKKLVSCEPSNYELYNGIVIDDIVDSGKTLKKNFKRPIASLVWKSKKAFFEPAFFAFEDTTEEFIKFPWETNESARRDYADK